MELTGAVRLVTGWLESEPLAAPQRVEYEYRSEPRLVALHEAAHATVGYRYGIRIVRACMHMTGGGMVEAQWRDDEALPMAVAALAGIFAELYAADVIAARQRDMFLSWDIRRARDTIARGQLNNAVIATAAGCSVWVAWPQIVRVADVLQAGGTVDGDTIARICEATK